MIPTYVLDTRALIAAERHKQRATRFIQLAHLGRAQLVVPLPVIAEWWRGRSDDRDDLLAACTVSASVAAMKAAGVALNRMRDVDAKLTIDAIVVATAALVDGTVVTGDHDDLVKVGVHFPGVVILST